MMSGLFLLVGGITLLGGGVLYAVFWLALFLFGCWVLWKLAGFMLKVLAACFVLGCVVAVALALGASMGIIQP